jgi:DNA-binding CsgD family transcriptional regulator/uncharacterized membrane protein YhaH (DUF805 family)
LENDPVRIIKVAAMDSLRLARLTERQRTCLHLVHAHLSSKEIATKLGIGPGTVDQHIKAAMQILGVCDRRSAARMLVDHEAARPERPVEAPAETAPGVATPTINVMNDILASVRHGLGNLLNFSGRDTREQFRLYAIFLLVMGVTIPVMVLQTRSSMAFVRIQQLIAAHPEQAGNVFQWKRDHPEFLPNLADLPFILGLIVLFHFALIAAAVARRRHDWTRTELWGALLLPIVNIAAMLKLWMLLLFVPGLIVFAVLYALIRGGAPERIAAAMTVVGTFLIFVALWTAPLRLGGIDISAPVLDSAGLLAFLLLALRANRFWPIWLTALNGLGLITHIILRINPTIDPGAYGLVGAISTPFFSLILFVGTRNHQLRLRHYGADPAWTPRVRTRRRATGIPGKEREQAVGARYIET